MMVLPLIGRVLWRSFQSFQSLGNLMHAQGSLLFLLLMDVARFEIIEYLNILLEMARLKSKYLNMWYQPLQILVVAGGLIAGGFTEIVVIRLFLMCIKLMECQFFE